jgi:hypothetical protein
MSPYRSETVDRTYWQVLSLVLVVLTVKAVFLLKNMPSMWIWADESYYYVTAYDLLNLGRLGVPHPGFLYYPPLTSIFISPVHLFALPDSLTYPSSLIILTVLHATGVVAAYLLVYELFHVRSRLLVLLLLVGSPAYMSLCLMSETPFIALFMWLLYFYVRQLKNERARDALIVGLLVALMMLTRKSGVGVIASLVVSLVLGAVTEVDPQKRKRIVYLHSLNLVVGLGLALSWKVFMGAVLEAKHGYYDAAGYVEHGLLPALGSVRRFFTLSMKFFANLGYLSLSSYGICVPLLTYFFFTRHPRDRAEQRLVRQILLFLLVFAVFAAFVAAVHMFINRLSPNPRYYMYGRYMEYFALPLLALTFGYLATGVRWTKPQRLVLVLMTALLSLAILVTLPMPFYYGTIAKNTVVPNYMGIAWLFGLGGTSVALILGLSLILPVSLALLLTSRAFQQRRAVKIGAYLVVLLLAVTNLTMAAASAAEKSRAYDGKFMAFRDFIDAQPQLFTAGMYLDLYPPDRKKKKKKMRKADRTDQRYVQRTIAERADKVMAGNDPSPYLGAMPVMSRREYHDYEILFTAADTEYRVYGKRIVREQ